jgi:uncharacterized Ntn-hydrolase superfamily protein
MKVHLLTLTLLAVAMAVSSVGAVPGSGGQTPATVATYSIVARDPVTGDLGVAVQSRFLAVGAVVPWASATSGAIATQARANTTFGPEGLRMLGYGWTAAQTLDSLLAGDPDSSSRQVGIVDRMGNAAAFTGSECRPFSGQKAGAGYTVQGNMLAGAKVLDSMTAAFERTGGGLAERLIATLHAAERAGGDSRGRQSAALLIVRDGGGYDGLNDRYIDLRVDDHTDPVGELDRLYALWSSTFQVERRLATIDRFNSNRQYAAAQEETQRLVESLNAQLRDHPDDPEVLNRIAWVLSTYDLAKDRAIELANRAVKLAPGDPRFKDTLAECHFRLGHLDEAIRIESEIVAGEPGNERYRSQLQKFLDARPK